MMRILLILLAVLIAVLSFVLDQVWLNWTAGALIIVALGAVATHLWQRYSETKQYQSKGSAADREDELRELGIMDVRPQSAESPDTPEVVEEREGASNKSSSKSSPKGQSSGSREKEAHPTERKTPSQSAAPSTSPSSAPSAGKGASARSEATAAATADAPAPSETPSDEPADASALEPYLEALRRAIGAHTVCLLVQEEMALAYRIAAIQSTTADIRAIETVFETSEPLVTASMSRQTVTVRGVGSEGGVPLEALGYYTGKPPVAQLAVAPVPRSGPVTYVLCADASHDVSLDIRRVRALLARFAEGIDLLITAEETPPEPAPTETDTLTSDAEADLAEDGASPRPRREIIAEEMKAAQQQGRSLALALVHLNRAESLARTGDETVTTAEQELRTRLQQAAPDGRVERFGELTFGVFYYGGASDVERWAEQLQEEMAHSEGVLEGGVSVGVAMWRHQEPEALREAATEALRVAYETGDCTIVE